MVPARPHAPAASLFGAVNGVQPAVITATRSAAALQAALAQAANVSRVRELYSAGFTTSIN